VRNGVRSDAYDLLEEQTGLARKTVQALKQVSDHIDLPNRLGSLSWTHHFQVYLLPPAEQKKWLKMAEKNDWEKRLVVVHKTAQRGPSPRCRILELA